VNKPDPANGVGLGLGVALPALKTWGAQKGRWLVSGSGSAAAAHSASLLAGLLVVRVLFKLAEQAALLQLHIEALKGRVDRLVWLYGYINQKVIGLRTRILCPIRA